MRRKKSFIIVGIIAAVSIVAGSAVAYNILTYEPVPSETELPDQKILSNLQDMKEVKAFLNKYPATGSGIVDRSGPGGLHVDYSVSSLDLENDERLASEYRLLTLRVFADQEGNPKLEGMEVRCFDGKDTTIIRDNILNYIETETCLGN